MAQVVVRTSIDLVKLAKQLRKMGYEEVSPGDLAELFGTNRVWAGKVLAKMEELGLVERLNSRKARPAKYRIIVDQ
ncbi:MAG: hypothetical protein GXO43_00740 [Crenarchaeota archaeon]|nr:hypothetical protein [Thermoproteota archaeon]